MKKSEILARYAEMEVRLRDIYAMMSDIKERFAERNWASSMRDSIPGALVAINTTRRRNASERRRFEACTEAELAALDFASLFRDKDEEIERHMAAYRTFKSMT